MYMDKIKLFGKKEKELEIQIQAVRIYSQDKIRTLGEKETYKCLRILEADTIQHVQMKEKTPQKNETTTRNQITAEILLKG